MLVITRLLAIENIHSVLSSIEIYTIQIIGKLSQRKIIFPSKMLDFTGGRRGQCLSEDDLPFLEYQASNRYINKNSFVCQSVSMNRYKDLGRIEGMSGKVSGIFDARPAVDYFSISV